MLNVVSGRELFAPGSTERFLKNSDQVTFNQRVEDIVTKAGVIRKSHRDGRPNHSHDSTAHGASVAAQRLIAGKKKKFIRDDDKWFGQNLQETWFDIKKFFQ